MTSRLNQLNTRLELPYLHRAHPAIVDGCGVFSSFMRVVATLRYRIPSSPMPRSALAQPNHRQPAATHETEFGQGVDRVLATGRREPARRQSQRGHRVAVQLNEKDHASCADRTH